MAQVVSVLSKNFSTHLKGHIRIAKMGQALVTVTVTFKMLVPSGGLSQTKKPKPVKV